MALTLDPATRVISVPQADLTLITGTLYEMDTDQFRKDVWDLLSSEPYIWLPPAFTHNTEVTVAGTTFAHTLEFINGYSVEFEDGLYSVRLVGSNNNIFDVENGILAQNQVQVIPTNSAGLISSNTVESIKVVVDAIKVVTDALTASAAANLALSAAGIIGGVATGTPTTTVISSTLSGFEDNELIGRAIIFTGGTATGQLSDVTSYASAGGVLTVTALTTAPVSGDTFVIV